jgi:exopolysaccharide biosynthesis polyprenyl glycosylphosphotransferase
MLRRFSLDFAIFSIALDIVLITLALGLATSYRPAMNELAFVKDIPGPIPLPKLLYLSFPILWTLILYFFSVYDSRRNLRVWKEFASLSAGSLLAMVTLAGILYLSFREISRLLYLSFAILAFIFILTWRIIYRISFKLGLIKAVQPRRILIIGSGIATTEIEKQVDAYQNLGLTIVGFIGDSSEVVTASQSEIALVSEAQQIIQKLQVDDVVVTMSVPDHNLLLQVISKLSLLPVKLWIIPDYLELAVFKAKIDEFAGIPMLDLRAPGLTETQRVIKRSFDLLLTFLLSPLYLPVMGLIALLIRGDKTGPVLFRQARAGENGRIFNLYKFRSMVANAEELRQLVEHKDSQGRLVYKTQDDPRITRIGRVLRRTSLDELPQFYNVLRGEMSLVGPRPELPQLVKEYEPWQHKRFSVPPGMTGWWQVHGRSDRPMHLNTQDDLYYIENYSIFLDISILIKTIGAVWRRIGAY